MWEFVRDHKHDAMSKLSKKKHYLGRSDASDDDDDASDEEKVEQYQFDEQ